MGRSINHKNVVGWLFRDEYRAAVLMISSAWSDQPSYAELRRVCAARRLVVCAAAGKLARARVLLPSAVAGVKNLRSHTLTRNPPSMPGLYLNIPRILTPVPWTLGSVAWPVVHAAFLRAKLPATTVFYSLVRLPVAVLYARIF